MIFKQILDPRVTNLRSMSSNST